ncbi:MAG: protein kinase domain-containing protein [Streptosporangiaceae bacterium]
MTQDVRSGQGDLAPGERIAGYEVQEPIGRGGMAVVYRALDLRLGRLVALKVLAPHLGEDEAFRQRFIRESRAAAGVDHPHIIPVFEAGESGDVLFIAMRYVSHGDVRSLLDAEGSLSPARTLEIAGQVASALDAAHAYGLVHRDVKPGNVLLGQGSSSDSEHVYLSDFGLSKHSLSSSTLTSTGQFLGTLDYVSPEQIQGQPVDGRADQYALACTVAEMLTGTPPFRRDDSMALMWAQLEAEPPRLTQRRPDLPPAVDQVIAKAMSKSPASRYPTCRDFVSALGAALAGSREAGNGAAAPDSARMPAQAAALPRPAATPGAEPAPRHDRPDDAHRRPAGPVPSPNAVAGNAARDQPHQPRRGGTEHAGFRPTQQTRPDEIIPVTSPVRADRAPRARSRGAGAKGRRKMLAAVITVVGLAAVGGIGYSVLHRPQPTPTPTVGNTTRVHALGPAATVRRYFAAINNHQYREAWDLSDQRGSFAKFAAGYAGTAHDTLTNFTVSGNVVSLTLHAFQTHGPVKIYQGSYTVVNGVITHANVNPVRPAATP